MESLVEEEGDASGDVVEVAMTSCGREDVAAGLDKGKRECVAGEEDEVGGGIGPAWVETSVVDERVRKRRKREGGLAVEVERSIGGPKVRRQRDMRGGWERVFDQVQPSHSSEEEGRKRRSSLWEEKSNLKLAR